MERIIRNNNNDNRYYSLKNINSYLAERLGRFQVWEDSDSDDVSTSDEIRSSTGLAIDWMTPIGPLNFSLAQPLSKSKSDITESFRFNIGTTF